MSPANIKQDKGYLEIWPIYTSARVDVLWIATPQTKKYAYAWEKFLEQIPHP